MTSSLLDAYTLPRFSHLVPEAILPALDAALDEYSRCVEQLVAEKPTTFETLWKPLERAQVKVDALWSAVSQLNAVRSDEALRVAYDAGQARLVETGSAIGQNRPLFDLLQTLSETADFAARPPADRAAVLHMIRGCKLSGVGLEAGPRARYAEIELELSGLSTEFDNAVKDATDNWCELVTDRDRLAGLPESALEMFAASARERDADAGWLVTLQMPSVNAILTFAENRDLRRRVYEAFGTRASDRGPDAGRFDNSGRIARIVALRAEAAALLGFADPVEQSLSTKMADSSGTVLAFLRDLARHAKPAAARELEELRSFAAASLAIADLEPWDIAFVSSRMRLDRYGVDEAQVREYFPAERVLQGWRELLATLFGVRLFQRDDVDVWHGDVRYYDLAGEDGEVFAGLYVDLYARSGKRGGAWMAEARPRLETEDGTSRPVAYLTCNFSPVSPAAPSLLSQNDVRTLLHETGHCLHHLFTAIDRPSVAGPSGFEWDAVELPSQLMEDFAWDLRVLTSMSGHYRTGESLPADLFVKLTAARRFQSAMGVVRNIEFSLFDILLHLGELGYDPMTVIAAAREEAAVIVMPEWHRFPHSFTHIFAGGYAAGYYSYLWAEVLAADAFAVFAEAGLLDRATGDKLRADILSRGASRPAAESFRAFRGRDPDPAELLRRRGLLELA